jgi:hypothetical protein
VSVSCRHCGNEFTPSLRAGRNTYRGRAGRERSLTAAQFCSAKCRQANHRWRSKQSSAVTREEAPAVNVTADRGLGAFRTGNASLIPLNGLGSPSNTPPRAAISPHLAKQDDLGIVRSGRRPPANSPSKAWKLPRDGRFHRACGSNEALSSSRRRPDLHCRGCSSVTASKAP